MKGARGGGAHFGLSPSRSSQVCLQTHESCFPGGLGCVCCLLWFTVIYDDPARHPCISVREKEHIVSSLAPQVRAPALAAQRPGAGGLPRARLPVLTPTLTSSVLSVHLPPTLCPHQGHGQMPASVGHFHGLFQPLLVMHHHHNVPADVHPFCAARQHQRGECASHTSTKMT